MPWRSSIRAFLRQAERVLRTVVSVGGVRALAAMLPSTIDKTSSFTDVRPAAARARARARACGRVETPPPPMQAETAALDLIGRICALDGKPAPRPSPLRCAPCPGGSRRVAMAVIRAGRAALCGFAFGVSAANRSGLALPQAGRRCPDDAAIVEVVESGVASRVPPGRRAPALALALARHWHWPGAGTGPALALARHWR